MPSIGYNKDLIPLPLQNESYTFIDYTTTIRETIYIDESKKIMRLKKENVKEWFNSYLTFQNLKENSINIIHANDRENMWKPYYASVNTENELKCVREA